MLCTEIVSDIQKFFFTLHVLPMSAKKKSFWQRFTCTGHLRKEDKDENDENNSILKTISPFAAGIAEGLLLLSVYNYEHESPWAEFVEDKFMANCENKCDGGGYKNPIDQENDEKLMKVLNMTIGKESSDICACYIRILLCLWSSCFLRRPQKSMKSSPSIWHYVVDVKSTVKVSSIFVAFLENMNFNAYGFLM